MIGASSMKWPPDISAQIFNDKVDQLHPQRELVKIVSLFALSILSLTVGIYFCFAGSGKIGSGLVQFATILSAFAGMTLESYLKNLRELKGIINTFPLNDLFTHKVDDWFTNKCFEYTYRKQGGEISFWKVTKIQLTEESCREVHSV